MKFKPIAFLAVLLIFMACNFEGGPKKQNLSGEVWSVNESGDSVLNRYNENSKLLSYTTYRNGYKHGEAGKYYDNGKVEFKINYANGFKNGITYWYYETGKLYRVTNYKDGKKNGMQKRHYENGKIQAEIPYVYGEVQPGVKEYTKSGKLKTIYPKIIIQPIDRVIFNNTYTLQCSLTNNSKKVRFYKIVRYENGSFQKQELVNNKGIGKLKYHVPPGNFVMETVTIRAEFKTSSATPYVIEKQYNVAVDN